MKQKGAKAEHHRHDGLRTLLEQRTEFGGDLEENVIPTAESMRCYTRVNPGGTSNRGKYTLVAEVLGEGHERSMRVDCGCILLQGRKDEPVAMGVVELEDGTRHLLLAGESLFGRDPKMRELVAPERAFVGNGGNTRQISLDRIAEGFVPTYQRNPVAGMMDIVFKKPTVAT